MFFCFGMGEGSFSVFILVRFFKFLVKFVFV